MKKPTIVILAMFTLLTVLPAGCTKTSNPDEPKQEVKDNQDMPSNPTPEEKTKEIQVGELFPAVKGWRWEYQGEGNEYAAFKREVVFTEGNLVQLREDNGGTVTASVFEINPEDITRIFFSGEAYEEKNYLGSTSSERLILIKGPVETGTKWDTPGGGTREIIDTKASVTTPAGTFTDCVKIKISEQNSTSYEYYGSGIGLVMREFVSGEAKVTSALEKFNIPEAKQ